MGKRVATTNHHHHHHNTSDAQHHNDTPKICERSIRKRKRNITAVAAKSLRLHAVNNNNDWHENDDEDSSSNDAAHTPATQRLSAATTVRSNQSNKQANNSSILLNTSSLNNTGGGEASVNESPKPVYTLRPSVVNGTILYDLTQKPWRLGRPIGKGNFGEIFLASDNITVPVTNENAKFVVKIEPHSNGPLFVEIHCLINTVKKNSTLNEDEMPHTKLSNTPPSGIPDYIASGSHYFGDARYRFLVLPRFDRDLHSIIKNCRVHEKSVLTLALQIVNVLENLHDKGYCHNDVKAQNLMISKSKYLKTLPAAASNNNTNGKTNGIKAKYYEHYEEKQQTTDSGNSSEQEAIDDEDDEDFVLKRHQYEGDDEEDEDFDDGATTNSINSNSMDIYQTPINKQRKARGRNVVVVEFSGSNPVRSCRRKKRNSIYDEMVKSHYLRPAKRISYSEFYNEDGVPIKSDSNDNIYVSSDNESEEFVPHSARRTTSAQTSNRSAKCLTRRQGKLSASLNVNQRKQQHQHQQHQTRCSAMAAETVAVEEERIFLIDFGLASKFMNNGVHRPFVMDQRRAHDGTLEFTSRDAHMGAHSRRSDLECLGYNLLFWSQGYLPWKDAATQHQQEKVHRAKEYLMTDVREMLKQIYGKQVPKYLGEFLHHVGQLAYHDRPDYALYRRILEKEYQQLGYGLNDLRIDSREIMRTCVRVKDEIENKIDIFEMNKNNSNTLSIMKNLPVGTPFHEHTSNRVSPKNLRSKSSKKSMKKKKFSWAEVLSQDPDQIARERAEKEFDREEELSEVQQPTTRHYEGKPTYAILEIEARLRMNGRLLDDGEENNDNASEEEPENEDEDENESEKEEVDENEHGEDEADVEMTEADEEDNENDDEYQNESEEDDDEEQIETDATEASAPLQANNGRTRSTRRTRITKTNTTQSVYVSSAEETPPRTRKRAAVRKTKVTTKKLKSRNSSCTKQTTTTTRTTSTSAETNGKRGRPTRLKRKNSGGNVLSSNGTHAANTKTAHHAMAAANGENEHRLASSKCVENGHNGHKVTTECRSNGGGGALKLPERRTRRCLIKTDAGDTEEDSNSNFSPDVRSLFNVWKKINNESMYYRGSTTAVVAAAAATTTVRHCRK